MSQDDYKKQLTARAGGAGAGPGGSSTSETAHSRVRGNLHGDCARRRASCGVVPLRRMNATRCASTVSAPKPRLAISRSRNRAIPISAPKDTGDLRITNRLTTNFVAAVAQNAANAMYRVRWGRLLHERFNNTDAEDLFKEALQRDPKNAQAYLGLALVSADGFDSKAIEWACGRPRDRSKARGSPRIDGQPRPGRFANRSSTPPGR